MNTDKLAINWQNFVRIRPQLKFAFIIRLLDQYLQWLGKYMRLNSFS